MEYIITIGIAIIIFMLGVMYGKCTKRGES